MHNKGNKQVMHAISKIKRKRFMIPQKKEIRSACLSRPGLLMVVLSTVLAKIIKLKLGKVKNCRTEYHCSAEISVSGRGS